MRTAVRVALLMIDFINLFDFADAAALAPRAIRAARATARLKARARAAGIACTADRCVFATAQDAYVRQYSIWIPADCVAASSRAYEKAAIEHMARTLKARTRPSRGVRAFTWSTTPEQPRTKARRRTPSAVR